MTMTEWYGLLMRDSRLRDVGRAVHERESISGNRDHEERPEDADPRDRVRAAVKYLRHDAAHNTCRAQSRKITESELE